jgi:hypothetical protein
MLSTRKLYFLAILVGFAAGGGLALLPAGAKAGALLDDGQTSLGPCLHLCRRDPSTWVCEGQCIPRKADGGQVGDPFRVQATSGTVAGCVTALGTACTAAIQ